MKPWSIIETEEEYNEATKRFEEIYDVGKESPHFKEMLLLALLINQYEKKQWSLPEVDPIEMIKIRMEDFGYKPADLAKAYGDKGTVSKVLNYKQPLSLNMIRVFSKMLRIPADALVKEYKLQQD
jgi:HTH-type transcriptional regulator/antitoxin HigA